MDSSNLVKPALVKEIKDEFGNPTGQFNAWPREYLSWSQAECWRRGNSNGHYEYFRRYLYGEPLPTTPQMRLGAEMAAMLEHREVATDDPMLEHYRHFMPKYEHVEETVRARYGGVPLLAKPDGFTLHGTPSLDPLIIITGVSLGETKTGKSWTQERADEHKQIDLYDIVFWQKYGVIPENTLHWIPTYKDGAGEYRPTGEIFDYPTPRTEAQLIESGAEFIRIWHEIGESYGEECRANGLI